MKISKEEILEALRTEPLSTSGWIGFVKTEVGCE
jgi:hypothetical protein